MVHSLTLDKDLGPRHERAIDTTGHATIYALDCSILVQVMHKLYLPDIQRFSETCGEFWVVSQDYTSGRAIALRPIKKAILRKVSVTRVTAFARTCKLQHWEMLLISPPPVDNADRISQIDVYLYDRIANFVRVADFARLKQTSRLHSELIAGLFYSRFCKAVATFGLDPLWLLRLLRKTKSIISGSAAVLMVHPDQFVPNDLDIIVDRSNATALILKIVQGSDFHHIGGAPGDYSTNLEHKSIDAIHFLVHRTTNVEIKIIVSRCADPLHVVLNFDSTHVMNVITPTGFASAYPILTSMGRGLFNIPARREVRDQDWLSQQRTRGFKLKNDLRRWGDFCGHRCTADASCPQTARHFRDTHMLFQEFFIDEKHPRRHPLHHYEGNVVWALHSRCETRRGKGNIIINHVEEGSLGYVYKIN